MIDLSKLSPAPFKTDPESGRTYLPLADAEFIALARLAFEVMTRRGWWPVKVPAGWSVAYPAKGEPFTWMWAGSYEAAAVGVSGCVIVEQDPYSALDAAEKWYVANVERKDGAK